MLLGFWFYTFPADPTLSKRDIAVSSFGASIIITTSNSQKYSNLQSIFSLITLSMNISLTEVCAYFLSDYLKSRDLFTKDFPTDTERFDAILDEFKQKEALVEQERASEMQIYQVGLRT